MWSACPILTPETSQGSGRGGCLGLRGGPRRRGGPPSTHQESLNPFIGTVTPARRPRPQHPWCRAGGPRTCLNRRRSARRTASQVTWLSAERRTRESGSQRTAAASPPRLPGAAPRPRAGRLLRSSGAAAARPPSCRLRGGWGGWQGCDPRGVAVHGWPAHPAPSPHASSPRGQSLRRALGASRSLGEGAPLFPLRLPQLHVIS